MRGTQLQHSHRRAASEEVWATGNTPSRSQTQTYSSCSSSNACGLLPSAARPIIVQYVISGGVLYTSNKKFILKYFRCRDGKRTETRIGMEGICITHSCIPLYPSLYSFYAHAHETTPHPVISDATPTSSYKKGPEVLAVFALVCTFPAFS